MAVAGLVFVLISLPWLDHTHKTFCILFCVTLGQVQLAEVSRVLIWGTKEDPTPKQEDYYLTQLVCCVEKLYLLLCCMLLKVSKYIEKSRSCAVPWWPASCAASTVCWSSFGSGIIGTVLSRKTDPLGIHTYVFFKLKPVFAAFLSCRHVFFSAVWWDFMQSIG